MAFLDEEYLLETDTARELYGTIRDLPILDPHSHADVAEIVANEGWDDIWEVEGATDHYVWAAIRKRGVPEERITGAASNREKWNALAEVFPELVRLTEPGGLVVITCRDDVWGGLAGGATELAAAGAWTLVDRSASRPLHPGRETDGGAQSVVIWQVGGDAERASPKGRPSGGG